MIVAKIGGSIADVDPVLRDVAACSAPMVIVHGASRELNTLSTQLGRSPQMVQSERGEVSRYTDRATMDDFLMAYAGKANKRIVERLLQLSVPAIGLTGLDGGMVRGRRRANLRIHDGGRVRVLHDNHVGSIDHVDATLLRHVIDAGYTPVLCPPIAAEDGTAINVDGDRLASAVAVALRASHLIILSDTPGLLRDVDDERTMIRNIAIEDIETALVSVAGRARTKLRAAATARQSGVGTVAIADGRIEQPITVALAGGGSRVA